MAGARCWRSTDGRCRKQGAKVSPRTFLEQEKKKLHEQKQVCWHTLRPGDQKQQQEKGRSSDFKRAWVRKGSGNGVWVEVQFMVREPLADDRRRAHRRQNHSQCPLAKGNPASQSLVALKRLHTFQLGCRGPLFFIFYVTSTAWLAATAGCNCNLCRAAPDLGFNTAWTF